MTQVIEMGIKEKLLNYCTICEYVNKTNGYSKPRKIPALIAFIPRTLAVIITGDRCAKREFETFKRTHELPVECVDVNGENRTVLFYLPALKWGEQKWITGDFIQTDIYRNKIF